MNEGQPALIIATFSVLLASASLFVAFVARKQANRAGKDTQLSIITTIHFTDRFFDLLRDVPAAGIEHQILANRAWAYQFWSLYSTEFYFFHHGLLPEFMYSLWMVDLAALYAGGNGERVRKSHEQYLDIYSLNYAEMDKFYNHLYLLAKKHDDPTIRNKEIAVWIKSWYANNKPVT